TLCNPYPLDCLMTWNDDETITLDNRKTREAWDIHTGTLVASTAGTPYQRAAVPGIPVSEDRIDWQGRAKDGLTPFVNERSGALFILQNGTPRTLAPGREVDFADYRAGSPVILAGNFYSRVFLWDAQTGERLADMPFYAKDAALSPDSTRI